MMGCMKQARQGSRGVDTAVVDGFLAALSAFDREMVDVVEQSGVLVSITKAHLQIAGKRPAFHTSS